MKILTDDLLARLYAPTSRARSGLFVQPLAKAFDKYHIATLVQRAAFLATIGVESDGLTALSENLNYSADGLLRTWPSRFTPALAAKLARNPQDIANRVYSLRMGNGDEGSGDGWRYRGAGLIQITGKANQEEYARVEGENLSSVGDWLRTPEGATDSAGWFWAKHKLNDVASDMVKVTQIVNGGTTGLDRRKAMFAKAMELLA